MDHQLPPLYEPEPPPIPRHLVQPDPFETPVLRGGRAAYLIPLVFVVVAWQIDEHVGIALGLFCYGVLIVVSMFKHENR